MVARLLAVCLAIGAWPAVAHHPNTVYDHGRPIEVAGVVREFRWTSPHAWVFLDVAADSAASPLAAAPEAVAWAFEGTALSVMVRQGWRSSSLKPGDRVRVLAAPRKDGTRAGKLLSITLTDSGKVLGLGPM